MGSRQKKQDLDRQIQDSPIAWFYTLEDARRRGDFVLAARAQRQLARLGIQVRYVAGRAS